MLRTRRTANGRVLFTLSGRIETAEDIKQLQQLLAVETSGQQLILDLRDVTLVSQDAVKFLLGCEADGIKLENCPLHVRRWIDQVKDQPSRHQA
jgi:anti-anti-sigma regulatory factor